MATGLAATIEQKFGLHVELVQGHDGIYEIAVNNRLVYSNKACEHSPVDEEVFAEISKYKAPLTAHNLPANDFDCLTDAPACAWTPPTANQPI